MKSIFYKQWSVVFLASFFCFCLGMFDQSFASNLIGFPPLLPLPCFIDEDGTKYKQHQELFLDFFNKNKSINKNHPPRKILDAIKDNNFQCNEGYKNLLDQYIKLYKHMNHHLIDISLKKMVIALGKYEDTLKNSGSEDSLIDKAQNDIAQNYLLFTQAYTKEIQKNSTLNRRLMPSLMSISQDLSQLIEGNSRREIIEKIIKGYEDFSSSYKNKKKSPNKMKEWGKEECQKVEVKKLVQMIGQSNGKSFLNDQSCPSLWTESQKKGNLSLEVPPKNLKLSDNEKVDITRCPNNPVSHQGRNYSEKDFVTLGDLHGNAGKLVFFLVKEGIASFEPAENCQKILDFYNRNQAVTNFPINQELSRLIKTMVIKKPPDVPQVRLIGDELSDRGKNDGITIEILKKLHNAQPSFEIMVSNHSIEFLRDISGLENMLCPGCITSIQPIKKILSQKVEREKNLKDIKNFINEVYMKHLKLISVTPQSDGNPVVFTHAPTEPKLVYAAAKELGAATQPDCDTEENLRKNITICADKINLNYLEKLKSAFNDSNVQNNILQKNMSTGADGKTLYQPIADLFWNRHTGKREYEPWKTANGHNTPEGLNFKRSTFELNNLLGKNSFYNNWNYQVLRPTM